MTVEASVEASSEAFSEPSAVRVVPRPSAALTAQLAGALWRKTLGRAVLVPLIVLAPLIAVAPTADQRFNVYWHGALFRANPFRIVPHTLARLAPFAIGAGFVAAGASSTTVLFGAMYLTSTAVVLGTAAVVCRSVSAYGRRLGWLLAVVGLLGGVLLACFNEITYLAPPLATVAALVRGRWVLRIGWRRLATGRGARLLGVLWLGFLPVFVAVRVVIFQYCSHRACYRGSDIVLSARAVWTFPVRLVAWFPPLAWVAATRADRNEWIAGTVGLLALLVLAVVGWRAYRDLPRFSPVDTHGAIGVAVVAGALIALGAGMSALNIDVQTVVARGDWGAGWRESGATAAGGALLLVALGHLALPTGPRRRWGAAVLVFTLVALAATGAAANKGYRDARARTAGDQVALRVAAEMSTFDKSAEGNARRCALQARFDALYPGYGFSQRRFAASLDDAAESIAHMPFCRPAP